MKKLSIVYILFFSASLYGQKMTGNDVIEKLVQNVTCSWQEKTVDTFKDGNPEDEVTGIAVTFMATHEVLKKAIEKNCNLIITHEPTYYNHFDDKSQYSNDEIITAKEKFIKENNLMIWRFHDHWHLTSPDGIYVGIIRQLGWEKNLVEGTYNTFKFEPQTLANFSKQIQNIYKDAELRVVGNPEMIFTNAALVLGAAGAHRQISLLQNKDIEVIVAGETSEWTTVEYVRDAVSMGNNKAVILTGHSISEEGGMEYCAEWLTTFIKDIPIHFIPAGDPFWRSSIH